jgi:hypothetical protein
LAFEKAYGAQYDFKKLMNVNPLGRETPDGTGVEPWNKGIEWFERRGENHPLFGTEPWNKGKICPQLAGKEPWNKGLSGFVFTQEHKDNISEALKGREFSQEHKDNLSEACKGREAWNKDIKGEYSHMFGTEPWNKGIEWFERRGENHPLFGTEPWNKGKTSSKETCEKISKTRKTKFASGELEVWNKNKKCPELSGEGHWVNNLSDDEREKDSQRRSKEVKGENNPGSVLTARMVQDIKYMLITMTYWGAVKDIATLYNVNPETISNIKNGKTWKEVKLGDYKC